MQKIAGLMSSYSSETDSIGLNRREDSYKAFFYFDSAIFPIFPVGLLNPRDLSELFQGVSISKENLHKKLKEYFAALEFRRGRIYSDTQLEKKTGRLTKDSRKYKTMLAYASKVMEEPEKDSQGSTLRGFRRLTTKELIRIGRFGVTNLENILKDLFGESGDKQYNQSTLVSGLLNLPSLNEVIKTGKFPQAQKEINMSYLTAIKNLVENYSSIFTLASSEIRKLSRKQKLDLGADDAKFEISNQDKLQYQEFIEETDRLLSNTTDLDRLARFLYKDKIRRGKFFYGKREDLDSPEIKITRYDDIEKINFSDLAGDNFERNAQKIKRILKLIENRNISSLFAILQGEPGNGKTDTMLAALNALPKNARGIVLETRPGVEAIIYHLKEISEMHPDLYFVGSIDDIDSIVNARRGFLPTEEYEGVNQLLSFDSIYRNSKLPDRVVLMGATNRLYAIDPAIILRSGRVKHILNYPNPDSKNRKQIAEHFASKYKLKLENMKVFLERTEGFSGEDIHSIFQQANEEGLNLKQESLNELIEGVKQRRQLIESTKNMFTLKKSDDEEGGPPIYK